MNYLEIKKRRKILGLTQKELAELIGVSANTIYNYEKGSEIPQSKIAILSNVLYPNSIKEENILNEENENYQNLTNPEIEAHKNTLLNQLNRYIKDLEAVKKPNLIDLRQLKEAILMKAELQKELKKL